MTLDRPVGACGAPQAAVLWVAGFSKGRSRARLKGLGRSMPIARVIVPRTSGQERMTDVKERESEAADGAA
ncbi:MULTISPECIES: hypothetical protein [unclassified Nonomuraea]|uniref:hypothetical protein n=1 Tax=unclassified Nonomuraea TaxID=2593643 RepID=UPI0033FCAC4A